MPRVVGARADCSSHRIGRSGQQRLTPAEAAAAQMWKQVHQSIHQGNEEKLLDAIETLEKDGHMHEGTFAWTAAELAIQSRFDVPTHVAAWAAEDVLANFGTQPARSNLTFVSANVTRWRKDLAPWIGQHRPSVCILQETHVHPDQGDLIVNHALSGFFANLSGAIELSVYGVMQGRGSIPKMIRSKLLTPVMPAASWGGSETSFWNRVVVWLEACVRKFHSSSFALGAAKRIPEMWHGNHSQQEAFVTDLVALLRDHSEALVQPLLQVAREQRKYHAQAWAKQKSSSYICWLKHSSQKGMRPLFRSVKAEEAIHVRPFTDAPVQERIYLRWRQWFDLWTQPTGVDPELLCELRRRAVEQAGSLDPIPLDKAVAYFKKVPTKAPGLDGWTCEVLHNLQPNAVQAILDFFRHCELEASWPDQFVFSLIALLPKSDKRERPIALMHILYRSWVRLRWKLVADWQRAYSRQASWDKAVPGSQVLDVALSRLVLGESVRHQKHHLITLFLDLETFYDRCRFDDPIRFPTRLSAASPSPGSSHLPGAEVCSVRGLFVSSNPSLEGGVSWLSSCALCLEAGDTPDS
ncbi:unnamed protein product [Symbiodinium natans]|uniref:Reverse transcriptase domain-containing protein n=1 Tax=Symbiodinium natans TaxID=878477 RepID=A0A812KK72_9DINO|nr:unnamed protein product [Symbiodinium natans]